MGALFGGGAKKAAEQSRRQQEVANNRQLAELNRADSNTGLTRRRPRGRRLFSDAAGERGGGLKENLS